MSTSTTTTRRVATAQFLSMLMFGAATLLPAQGEVLFTADVEGHFAARFAGLDGSTSGGAARLGTLIAVERAREAVLLVDAGNFLGDARSSGAAAAVCRALGYDAMNVSFRDFRHGKDATLAAIREARLPAISCNLVDGESGELLLPAFVTVGAGDSKVAVLGATAIPDGLAELPHLRAQLAGVRVLPAVTALRQVLPQARVASSRVVVAFYGSAAAALSLQQELGEDVAVILAGGVAAEWLPDPGAGEPPLVGSPASGELGRLRFPDGTATPQVDVLVAGPEVDLDPKLTAVLQSVAATPAPPAASPSPRLALGKTVALDLSAENRGVRLRVHSAALVSRYGVRAPTAGGELLVLDVSLRNIIPLTFVRQQKVPTGYGIPALGDHLYLVVGGSRLARLSFTVGEAAAAVAAGHLPVKDLALPRLGAELRGNVVFEVPAVAAEQRVELRFYDFAHGHLAFGIAGDPPAPAAVLTVSQQNEVVELGVYGLEHRSELGGREAPAGMTWVVVDVRARSNFTVDADATAFDPKAEYGQRLPVGTVADWTDSRRYLQLVVDGAVGFAPQPGALDDSLPDAPRFLPDLMTGGKVAFLAPAAAVSLQLRCDFPNAKSSLDGRLLRPRGLTVAVAGAAPSLAELPAIASARDSQFEVRVTAQQLADEYVGEVAPGGARFLLCGVEVHNLGDDGEFFQPHDQLQLATAEGGLLAVDPVAGRGPQPALELLWVPPGERRRYTAVYRVPAAADGLRLAYASVDAGGARMLALPSLSATATASEPAARPTPAPEPAPVAPALPDILKPPHEPEGLEGVGLTAEQVNRAIDRGAEFLWHHVRTEDLEKRRRSLGDDEEHVLAALALVHAGAHEKFPDFDRALRGFLGAVDPREWRMYNAGLLSMLVEAYGDPSFLPAQRLAVRSILETQGAAGSWNYARSLEPALFAEPDDDAALRVTGGIPLEGDGPAPLVRTSDWGAGLDGDNSVSQYAVLGLFAAARSGIAIGEEAWQRAEASFRERQGADGSWNYHSRTYYGYGSMTCAGICSLALAIHELHRDPREDPAILQGLAWLDARFTVDKHPGSNSPSEWLYYYLYSIERVGRILDLDFVGRHEWYPLGARFLVDQQKPDGSWRGAWKEEDPRIGGSFALMFLTRATATLTADQLARGGEGTLKTGVRLPPGGRYYFILDASGSMLEKMGDASKWQIARGAVGELVGELPDYSEVALRVYGHRKSALEPDASDDTELVLPMRKLDKKLFEQRLQGLRARGKTPMAKSLLEAAKDLAGASEKQPVTLVLLTDGGEDSLPRQDPVAAAAVVGELVKPPRSAVRLHVIGFDIGRGEWIEQLQAMTAAGGGSYCPASAAEQLGTSLRAAVLGVPESFAVHGADGALRARGRFGDALRLPEGRYVLRTDWAGRGAETSFWINTERVTSVTFDARPLARQPAAAPAEVQSETVQAPEAPAAIPRFCTGCGKALTPGARFCPGCGTKVKTE